MNKTPLVFLHGFLGNTHEFDSIIPELKNKFTCVMIDLNCAPSYSLKNIAQFVKEKLSELGIDKTHFWGYSMGGRALLEFYRNYPQMCASLTLESVSPGLMDPQESNNRIKMDSDWANLIQTDPNLFLEKWYSQVLFSGFKKHKDFSTHMKLRESTLSPLHSKMIMEASPGANPHHFDVIESINVPTLVLVGQNDEKYLQIWGKLIDQNPRIAVSNIVLEPIVNAGHVVHLENPAGAVEAFLKFSKDII